MKTHTLYPIPYTLILALTGIGVLTLTSCGQHSFDERSSFTDGGGGYDEPSSSSNYSSSSSEDDDIDVIVGGDETFEDDVFLCGGKEYNPSSEFCYDDTLIPLCGGYEYDPLEEFCYEDIPTPLDGDP
jgi:hypothetical protein